MVNKVFAKKLLFIAMTFIILICTSGCGEDEEGVYKSETKALLKLSNEIKKSGEAFISSDKEERDLLIKLHKAYYEGKAGYDKARDKGYKIAEIKFKKENDKQDRRLTKQERTLRYVERRTSPEAAAQKEMSVAKNELMRSIETAYKKHFLDYNNFIAYTEMIIKQQKDESKINKAFETHPYSYAIPQKDIVFNEIQSKDTNEVQDTSVNYKDKAGKETPEFSGNVYVYSYKKASNDPGTKNNPFTIAQAIAYIDGGGKDNVYVKGVVSELVSGGFGAQYGNGSFYISDDGKKYGDATKDFEAYQVNWLGNQKWTEGTPQIAVGDVVILYGPLTKYKTTYETQGKSAAYIYTLNGKTK